VEFPASSSHQAVCSKGYSLLPKTFILLFPYNDFLNSPLGRNPSPGARGRRTGVSPVLFLVYLTRLSFSRLARLQPARLTDTSRACLASDIHFHRDCGLTKSRICDVSVFLSLKRLFLTITSLQISAKLRMTLLTKYKKLALIPVVEYSQSIGHFDCEFSNRKRRISPAVQRRLACALRANVGQASRLSLRP
jgi:hypothetical protein